MAAVLVHQRRGLPSNVTWAFIRENIHAHYSYNIIINVVVNSRDVPFNLRH